MGTAPFGVRAMTSAELIFKTGFAPQFTTHELRVLLRACETDDHRLTQGSTTTPPPLMCVQDWPCEAGCVMGFVGMNSDRDELPLLKTEEYAAPVGMSAGMKRDCVVELPDGRKGYRTVGAVEEFFAMRCFDADQRLGEPAACRHFLNWYDDTPRDEMRESLARWCRDVLTQRNTREAAGTADPSAA